MRRYIEYLYDGRKRKKNLTSPQGYAITTISRPTPCLVTTISHFRRHFQRRYRERSNANDASTPPNWYRSVYYTSRRLSSAEKNYSTKEHEALGMIYNITKFRHYLHDRKFTFHFDHSALLYLITKQSLTDRLARWMLVLQEFEFNIHHWQGV